MIPGFFKADFNGVLGGGDHSVGEFGRATGMNNLGAGEGAGEKLPLYSYLIMLVVIPSKITGQMQKERSGETLFARCSVPS
jgi:hypothetical protein